MKKTDTLLVGERTFCVLLLAFTLGVGVLAYQISGFSSANSPGAFPLGASAVMILAALSILLDLRGRPRADTRGWLDAARQFTRAHFPPRTLIFTALAVIYLATIHFSFYASTFGFLVLSMLYLRRGRLVSALAIAALLILMIYLMFTLAFSVYLP